MNLKTHLKSTRYSESFKEAVVAEYYTSELSLSELSRKHGIPGKSTVRNWLHRTNMAELVKPLNKVTLESMKRSKESDKDQRIKELEKALEFEKDKNLILNRFIELSEKELGITLPKKPFTNRSKK